ncbi:hypothetical protein [Eleftheria terrae]|uniref:hypothetical protein n=1 Tax=Eleftheria terrae TaxID=1597781 RepID=UPI00263AD982|nr:hypothetical protein [Eleftheria terrae]WKB54028.1 hypothetical protein N7L95_06465 [Eleftheria terrae]
MAVADKLSGGRLVSLPAEAGNIDAPVFEPEERWLRSAEPVLQQAAMWRWFGTRYEDPRLTTPHDKAGDYLYTDGGPYRADKVLHERFDGLVDAAVIDELVAHLRSEVGELWSSRPLDKTSS